MGFAAEQPGGFIGWVLEYGQIVAFIAQIFYWAGILLLLGYAVWQFKRWVNFQLGTGRSGQLRTGDAGAPVATVPTEKKSVSVEEFVD